MKKMSAIAAVMLIAGCSTVTDGWLKPGASDKDFHIDLGQCQAQAMAITDPMRGQIAAVAEGCLRGKGWYLQRTEWVGKDSISFANDDQQCAGNGRNNILVRGPEWAACLRERGWSSRPAQ